MIDGFNLEAGHVVQNLEGLSKYFEKQGRNIESIEKAVVNPENPFGYLGETKIYMLEMETENGEIIGYIPTQQLEKIENI